MKVLQKISLIGLITSVVGCGGDLFKKKDSSKDKKSTQIYSSWLDMEEDQYPICMELDQANFNKVREQSKENFEKNPCPVEASQGDPQLAKCPVVVAGENGKIKATAIIYTSDEFSDLEKDAMCTMLQEEINEDSEAEITNENLNNSEGQEKPEKTQEPKATVEKSSLSDYCVAAPKTDIHDSFNDEVFPQAQWYLLGKFIGYDLIEITDDETKKAKVNIDQLEVDCDGVDLSDPHSVTSVQVLLRDITVYEDADFSKGACQYNAGYRLSGGYSYGSSQGLGTLSIDGMKQRCGYTSGHVNSSFDTARLIPRAK